jgi:hypothetical protein
MPRLLSRKYWMSVNVHRNNTKDTAIFANHQEMGLAGHLEMTNSVTPSTTNAVAVLGAIGM